MKEVKIPKVQLERLYIKENKSSRKIARIYKCDKKTVLKKLRKYNIKPRHSFRKPGVSRFVITKKELEKLYYNKNLTIYDIAKIYNCSPWTVWKRMKECKIEVRNRNIYITKKALENLYRNKKLPGKKIADIYNCSRPTVIKLMKKHGIKIRSHSEAVSVYEKKDFNGNSIEKAYLIGFSLGDLNVVKASNNGEVIVARCGTTKNEQIVLFKKLFKEYGHINEIHRFRKGTLAFEIYALLNNSFNFLLNKKDDIEKWILRNDKYFLAFLAGYMDAEGNIFTSKRRKSETSIKIESCDGNVLRKTRTKLYSMNIKCPDPRVYIRVNHNKPLWSLRISTHNSVTNLLEKLIPLLKHKKRLEDAKVALENTKRYAKFCKIRNEG